MLHNYPDITSRIEDEPRWYDENGVPRYDEFSPDLCPYIYAEEVVLYEIGCQDCGRVFKVQGSSSTSWAAVVKGEPRPNISERLDALHYGDPPAHGCIGDTMNCLDIRVVEFWARVFVKELEWERRPDLEIDLADRAEATDGED